MEATARKPHCLSQAEESLTAPSTPKKRPIYASVETPPARQRIKSFTQTKEKESASLVYVLLVFLWILGFGLTLFMASQTKIRQAEAQAVQDI